MYENIDQIIDLNLKHLLESKSQFLFKNQLTNEKGAKLGMIICDRVAEVMQSHQLVDIEGDRCDLTRHGFQIAQGGGWLRYLEVVKEQDAKQQQEEKIASEKLRNEHLLAKWQVKTFWWIFVLGGIGGLYGIYDFASELSKEKTSNTVSKEELEDRMNELRTSIFDSLAQQKLDTTKKAQ